jgi:phosphohistidine phosphatase
MLKTLYIARHAKSSWDDPSLSDFERPLNKRGKRDAPFMAGILACRGESPELILSSPAERAKKTAEIYHHYLGGKLRFEDGIYEATAMRLFYLVQEAFQEANSVMIVGHNPGLTELNDYLSDIPIFNIPTAGVVALEFRNEIAAKSAKQRFFEYPKKYVHE